jgi:hypothetical protein
MTSAHWDQLIGRACVALLAIYFTLLAAGLI